VEHDSCRVIGVKGALGQVKAPYFIKGWDKFDYFELCPWFVDHGIVRGKDI